MSAVDEQLQVETGALQLLGGRVRSLESEGKIRQRCEIAALYMAARAYVLDNGFDGGLLAALDERADQVVEGWRDERRAGKR